MVYGSPIPMNRNSLWSFLKRCSASMRGPWIVMGDFNAILSDSERQGGVARPNSIGMKPKRMPPSINRPPTSRSI